ncbi:hypothetical protein Mapa_000221 [Marchantia paleacea]|nr:hypothetical protein Mapa_000221 [Marchantia paleacea]
MHINGQLHSYECTQIRSFSQVMEPPSTPSIQPHESKDMTDDLIVIQLLHLRHRCRSDSPSHVCFTYPPHCHLSLLMAITIQLHFTYGQSHTHAY